jgi:hypothetical protein
LIAGETSAQVLVQVPGCLLAGKLVHDDVGKTRRM